jgi:hypothetical protein
MSVAVTERADGRILEIFLSDKLTRADYARFVPVVDRAARKHRKIRLLVRLTDCHGWSMGALWADFKFDLRHYGHVDRVAFVGDTKWEGGLALFCRMFSAADIRDFDLADMDAAEEWVAEGVDETCPAGTDAVLA